MRTFEVVSLNVSEKKGEPKRPVDRLLLIKDHGAQGDAHAGPWHRQISLLAEEDIEVMRKKGAGVSPGDFAENITTSGIDLASLPVGSCLKIGNALLEVTQIGKECHKGCAIMKQVGDCIMPRRGIFAKVIEGGEVTNASVGTYGFRPCIGRSV
jgi:MOSC domain-containing protein YiiM